MNVLLRLAFQSSQAPNAASEGGALGWVRHRLWLRAACKEQLEIATRVALLAGSSESIKDSASCFEDAS